MPRAYDSRGRQAAAERNQTAVVSAFERLLFGRGYRAATIKAVADEAGVSAETVYKVFGGKAGLVKAVWDRTLAGDDEPVVMGRRPELAAVWAATDLTAKLSGYAAFVRGVHERTASLLALLMAAGPDAAEVVAASEQERLAGVTAFATHLTVAGFAADPDVLWVLTGPHPFSQLTAERGWTPAAYEKWLAGVLRSAIVPGPAATH